MDRRKVAQYLAHLSQAPDLFAPAISPGPNTYEFATRLGLRIDGRRLDFERYSHLVDIYSDNASQITLMCGAQTGKSAFLLMSLVRLCFVFPGGRGGYFFPAYPLAIKFSRDRLSPMLRENPEIQEANASQSAADDAAPDADNVTTRSIAGSLIYFLATGSTTATEGVPLNFIIFDEVRNMGEADMQRAEERTSAQDFSTKIKVSTAGIPDRTIHGAFQKGDQRYFHSMCRCPEGVVLSQAFPACVADMRHTTPALLAKMEHAFRHSPNGPWGVYTAAHAAGEKWPLAAYVCPTCGDFITDPRDGWWQAHGKPANHHSYQLPQLLGPQWPAGRILADYENPETDTTEFFNSKLGLPFLDPAAQPITDAILASCVDPSLHWFFNQDESWRSRHLDRVAMGVDTQDGYNVCWLKQVAPDGKWHTIHLEITLADDPFRRLSELMLLYRVQVCVIDGMPHSNEARAFALRHPGKVWIANYVEDTHGRAPLRVWHDRPRSPSGERDSERFKWRVTIARTKGLQWSLGKWKEGRNRTPNPRTLIQLLPRHGDKVVLSSRLAGSAKIPTDICARVAFPHLRAVAFIKGYHNEDAERRGILTVRAEHVGLDPHFAHADLYCSIAALRVMQPDVLGDEEEDANAAGDR